MAASGIIPKKQMKRMEPKKPQSWWWESHISPKNSKCFAENREEMDQNVKRMLKLIEEDGDSFAKKAEMYYEKRPELVSLVEECYRMYRSLAEHYDNVTADLRKNIPSELQSQGSGGISDVGSEPSSVFSPKKVVRPLSSNRAAGFDFFLGTGGNGSEVSQKEDESSTLTDSEGESDDSSINNYSVLSGNGGDNVSNRRILELEMELREVKEKLWMLEEENAEFSSRGSRDENIEATNAKGEQRIVNGQLELSKEEINKLKIELEKYRSMELANTQTVADLLSSEDIQTEGALLVKPSEPQEIVDRLKQEYLEPESKIKSLEEELRITKEKLKDSEKQIASLKSEGSKSSERIQQLQDQLDLARKDAAAWKTKFNSEKRESTKLQERLSRLKSSLSDRDHEIRDLKTAVSDAEQKIFPEKAQIKSQMSKLQEERTHLQEQVREWECRGRSFEEEIRKINAEKTEMEKTLKGEIEQLKADIRERESSRKDLNVSLDALKLERENLNAEICSLKREVNKRDDRIGDLDRQLNQLHLEHLQLIAEMEELKSRAKKLEEEVEGQRTEIAQAADDKREAIRQLCFSIEHYRNEYQKLREALSGHQRVQVLAA